MATKPRQQSPIKSPSGKRAVTVTVTCGACSKRFEARSARAKFCSDPCRKAASRARAAAAAESSSTGSSGSGRSRASTFEVLTRRELERLGKVDTMLGQQALLVARSMATESGSALVTLSKEHGRLMAALGFEVEPPAPAPAGRPMSLDEIGRRRAEKEHRAREAGS